MSAQILDGKAFAATIRAKVADHVSRLMADHDIQPGLAVVLVGEDPASEVYGRNKGIATRLVDMALEPLAAAKARLQKSLDKLAMLMPGRYAKNEISGGFVGSIDRYAYRMPIAPTLDLEAEGEDGSDKDAVEATAQMTDGPVPSED